MKPHKADDINRHSDVPRLCSGTACFSVQTQTKARRSNQNNRRSIFGFITIGTTDMLLGNDLDWLR